MSHVNFTIWGEPDGIPEGSDFRLEAVLTRNGASDSGTINSSGTFTLTVSDSVLNAGTALLTDEASDSTSLITAGTLVAWEITDTQSSAWEAGTYNGDIKLSDSAASITFWPIRLTVRTARD